MSYYGFALAVPVPSQRNEDFIYAYHAVLSRYQEYLRFWFQIISNQQLSRLTYMSPVSIKLLRVLPITMTVLSFLLILDKSLVEDQVKLFYNSVSALLRNRIFYSLGELNAAIAEKMKAHNQKRMQQRPYSREE